MKAQLRILGCSGGLPAHGRWTTSQLLLWDDQPYLIDCGEGAQIRLQQYYTKIQRIRHIFISHLHGDHIYGLPGLLSSYTLGRRTASLTIYGPVGLRRWIESTLAFDLVHLGFELSIIEVAPGEEGIILESRKLLVKCIALEHRIHCLGYLFSSHPDRNKNIKRESISQYSLTHGEIREIKEGADLERSDLHVPHSELTHPHSAQCYAFCTDTKYFDGLAMKLKGVTQLYLECTYEAAFQDLAEKNYHCTTTDVIRVAKQCGCDRVLLGHYSGRYAHLDVIDREMRESGVNYVLSDDGMLLDL